MSNTHINCNLTKKKFTELKNPSNNKTQDEDYFNKVKKVRESKSQTDHNNSRAFTISNNGKRDKQHFHTKPVNIVQDANEKINLKIIENYHRIFLNEKRKDHNYSEKRFFVSGYEKHKKDDEKIYLTGILMSDKINENDRKIQSRDKTSRKSGNRPLIPDLEIEEETKRNIVDFNNKYMTQEAKNLREKLISRQSRVDSTNNPFPALTSNAEKNIFSKETNETENKIDTKTYPKLTKNFIMSDIKNNKKTLYDEDKSNSDLFEDRSIKKGLEVEFNDGESYPNLSEVLDSDNDLNLNEDETKKLIVKNLAKQYNFKQDEEVRIQLMKLKKKNKQEKGNKDKKELNNNNNDNLNNLNNKKDNYHNRDNKQLTVEANKTKSSALIPSTNQKDKIEENNKRKKYIGELIRFDSFSERNGLGRQKFGKFESKNLNSKIDNLINEETLNNNDLSISSNNSLINQVKKIYKIHKKNTESFNARSNVKNNRLLNSNKINKNENKNSFNDKIQTKAVIINDFKNTNFFHKFKLFDNSDKKLNLRKDSHIGNFSNENSNNNKGKSIFNKNYHHNPNKKFQESEFLTEKEIKEKKLDEQYVKSIDYDKIMKNNLEKMKNLFPGRKHKKNSKDFDAFRKTHFVLFKNLNDELKHSSRNSILIPESNNNTQSIYNVNNNDYNNFNSEIKIQYNYECNAETYNHIQNERNAFRKNEKLDKTNTELLDEIDKKTENKLSTSINNSNLKKLNTNNNSTLKFDNNTLDNVKENGFKKKFNLSPINKKSKNNLRKFTEYEDSNKNDEAITTYAQAISKIIKGKNEIFDYRGGINIEFLSNLKNINNNNENIGNLSNKCYDTKNYEKFNKELIEKINQIRKKV